MIKRKLGQTDIQISPIGLGTVKFGRNQAVKYPKPFEIPDDKSIKNILSLCQELGINFLDTAPAYGNSEERLGKVLKSQRDRWVISTKVGEEFQNGQSTFHFDRKHIQMSIERSLQRLQTDYLDIVLVHSDGNDIDIIEKCDVFSTLAELKKQGLINAFGMSTKTLEGGLLTIEQADVVMTTYRQNNEADKQILDAAISLHKGVLIKKAFDSGHAVNQTTNDKLIENNLRFIFSHPAVTSVVIGSINPKHLQQNIETLNQILGE